MADEDFNPRKAEIALAAGWWEAVDELRETIAVSEDTAHRLRASEILLQYTNSLNSGFGEPFLPDEPEPEEDPEEA